MSSASAAKIAANIANAQHSTGPRTEEGRATSAKNATKSGLFAKTDCIRPGEEQSYEILDHALRQDLVPSGQLEHYYVDEIRRAMWRLRRCGEVEAAMGVTCAETVTETGDAASIPDPMQIEPTAKLQASVDRARAHCHRLVNRCIAELRKLQTERQTRNETTKPGTDLSYLGICDFHAVKKTVDVEARAVETRRQLESRTDTVVLKNQMEQAYGPQPGPLPVANQTQTPAATPISPVAKQAAKQTHRPGRNSRCTCGSGLKYKRCCARKAAPLPMAA